MRRLTIVVQVTDEEALLIADCLEVGIDDVELRDNEPSLPVQQLADAMREAVTDPEGAGSVYASNAFKALA